MLVDLSFGLCTMCELGVLEEMFSDAEGAQGGLLVAEEANCSSAELPEMGNVVLKRPLF